MGVALDHRLQKSRIICTFSIEEKVKAIRQPKKEAIIPDEDRWLVLVGSMWSLSALDGCETACLKPI